jgi:hypothetical protein
MGWKEVVVELEIILHQEYHFVCEPPHCESLTPSYRPTHHESLTRHFCASSSILDFLTQYFCAGHPVMNPTTRILNDNN